MTGQTEYRFDVAFSFPGEHRDRVERIARKLADRRVGRKRVLYDKWYAAEFARPNLDLYLAELYRKQSLLLVVFLCLTYSKKEWCGLEWRVCRDLLKEGQDERLMLLRLDHADIPGIYGIDGYLDISDISDEALVAEILDRLQTVTPTQQPDIDTVVDDLRNNVLPEVALRCGTIKVLTMEQPIELGAVYTEVNILEQLSANRRKSRHQMLQEAGLEDMQRFGLSKVLERVPALRLLESHQRVIIYGKPGAGKTTFLKHLAMGCVNGDFRSELVPAFVTLREYAEANSSTALADYIGALWRRCTPWSVLKAGRALILLDGIDEVRDRDFHRIRKAVNDFAIEFDACPIILTCRIAAREYTFEQFVEVEMSDFSDDQIRTFAQRWFTSQHEPEAFQPFAEKLKTNLHALELASNPLLLTLLCLIFRERRDFGETRTMLYREGLEILLRKWDAKRGIARDVPYGLSVEALEMLVSDVAYQRFLASEYFFDQDSLLREIDTFLKATGLQQLEPSLRPGPVLDSLESHLGLLVQRAMRVYSFSHLTFQEYLAARQIARKPSLVSELGPMIDDTRWREVWLLLISMEDADDLVLRIKEQVDRQLVNDAMLQDFLRWCNRKAAGIQGGTEIRSAARAFYFDLEISSDRVLDRALDRKKMLDKNGEIALDSQLSSIIRLAFDQDSITSQELDEVIAKATEAAKVIAPTLAVKLSKVRDALAREKTPLKGIARLWHFLRARNDRKWRQELRAAAIHYRDVGHGRAWLGNQRTLLKKYYNGNMFLLESIGGCRGLSNSTRQFIEDTMMMPWDDIQRYRKPGDSEAKPLSTT